MGRSKRFIGTPSARSMTCSEATSRRAGELQERAQRGQAQIAAAHRVVALLLQVVEERQDQVGRRYPPSAARSAPCPDACCAKSRNSIMASR